MCFSLQAVTVSTVFSFPSFFSLFQTFPILPLPSNFGSFSPWHLELSEQFAMINTLKQSLFALGYYPQEDLDLKCTRFLNTFDILQTLLISGQPQIIMLPPL